MIENLKVFTFYLLSITSIVTALIAITGRNLFRNLIYFGVFLISLAGIFYTLEADFIALSQVFVYVGGVVVLMMFAVMLTPQITKVLIKKDNNEIFWGYAIGIAIFITILFVLQQATFSTTSIVNEEATIESLGFLLMGDYLIAFEVLGLILLVSIVGAVYILKERNRDD